MTTLREAAQAALDALEQLQGGCTDHDDGTVEVITVWCPELIDDLRAALAAEPAQPPADVPAQGGDYHTLGYGPVVAEYLRIDPAQKKDSKPT